MGLSGISAWELLIILLIVVLLFGTKHLKTLGGDLGSAIRGFRKAMEGKEPTEEKTHPAIPRVESRAAAITEAAPVPEAPGDAGRIANR